MSSSGIFAERVEKMAENFHLMLSEMQGLDSALKDENYAAIVEKMQKLLEIVDFLEENVDDRNWPLPKYREMLFIY